MWKSELKIHELIVYKGSDDNHLYVKHFRLDNPELHDPKIKEFFKYVSKAIPAKKEENWVSSTVKDKRFDANGGFYGVNFGDNNDYIQRRLMTEHLLYAPFARKQKEIITVNGRRTSSEYVLLSYEAYLYPVFKIGKGLFAPLVPIPTENYYRDIEEVNLDIDKLEQFTENVDYFKKKVTKSDERFQGFAINEKDLKTRMYKLKSEIEETYYFTASALLKFATTSNDEIRTDGYSEVFKEKKEVFKDGYTYVLTRNHKFILSSDSSGEYMYDLQNKSERDTKKVHAFVVHDKNDNVRGISMIMNNNAFEAFKHNRESIFKPPKPKNGWYTLVSEYYDDADPKFQFDFDPKLYQSGIVLYDDLIDLKGTVKGVLKELHSRVATPEDVSNNHKPIFRFTSHPIVQYSMSEVIWLLCNELKNTNEDIVCKMNGMKNLEVFCKNNGILVLMLTSKYSTPTDLDGNIGESETRVHSHHPSFQITKSSGLKTLEPWKIAERENGKRYQNINKEELYEKLNQHHDAQNVLLIFPDRRILKYGDDKFLWDKDILRLYCE